MPKCKNPDCNNQVHCAYWCKDCQLILERQIINKRKERAVDPKVRETR